MSSVHVQDATGSSNPPPANVDVTGEPMDQSEDDKAQEDRVEEAKAAKEAEAKKAKVAKAATLMKSFLQEYESDEEEEEVAEVPADETVFPDGKVVQKEAHWAKEG